MNQTDKLDSLKGVGSKTAALFEKLDIHTISDLMEYYPRDYSKPEPLKKIKEIQVDTEVSVYAALSRPLTLQSIKRLQLVSSSISDETGSVQVLWFNQPYLKNTLKPGYPCVFSGKVIQKGTQLYLEQPSIYTLEAYTEATKSLHPVYALTKGISNAMITRLIRQSLKQVPLCKDPLPIDILKTYQLVTYDYACQEIHFPKTEQHMLLARKRLVFQEFFFFILALARFKKQSTDMVSSFSITRQELTRQVIHNLGYELTCAQNRVFSEILQDLTSQKVMTRLIQGDVGCGKTILAFLSMILMADHHYQSALMVPTEVLAKQHFDSLQELLRQQNLPFCAVLLTGSMTAKQKRIAYEKIRTHEADLIIGTHAVIQDCVEFHCLALVITDEQHRFGVKQRESLEKKGMSPHTMVMSATPIPRTLAIILYGDLDISVVDELPSNRIPIKNCVVSTGYRKKAYEFIEREVFRGHQAYVICPMVEESELLEAEDVLSYTEHLQQALSPSITISPLHGKMKPKEKTEIMNRFLNKEIQVLVSTTVVEVGVNVPNATVIMIENAERFGLAQLHQLRGRVGRGNAQSYCILMASSPEAAKKRRLEILSQSNDGFYIASEDLKLRGPGDILGVRQSGVLEFKLADIYTDARLLQQASEAVQTLLLEDPSLSDPNHQELKEYLSRYIMDHLTKLNI